LRLRPAFRLTCRLNRRHLPLGFYVSAEMHDILRVRAAVRLLSEAEGGRSSPVVGGYAPNHNLFGADDRDMLMGRFALPVGEALSPGQRKEVVILFSGSCNLLSELKPGRAWRIQEGGTLVAWGEVIELLSE